MKKSRNVITNDESTPKTVVQSDATAEERSNSAPSSAEIRRRAFEIYTERGGSEGCDLDDWLQAERELREKHQGNGKKNGKK